MIFVYMKRKLHVKLMWNSFFLYFYKIRIYINQHLNSELEGIY